MREMGTRSQTHIEPPEQTALLDACISVAGVIGGGVPGAAGYDAVWLLVCDPANCPPEELPAVRVERVWTTYSSGGAAGHGVNGGKGADGKRLDVSPLLAAESAAKGVRVERLADISGLEAIVRGT